jgi:ABC-type transporter Mla subunit MlaD
LRLAGKKMAKKTNELEDLVQQIEDLIAELAHLQDPQIQALSDGAERNINEVKGRIAEQSGPAQAPP